MILSFILIAYLKNSGGSPECKILFVRSKDRILKRKDFLTVMVIPHNEKPSYKISITYKAITLLFLAVSLVLATSAVIVLGYSGRVHEMEELEISSNDFQKQSLKLKSEMNLLHDMSNYYFQKFQDYILS